MPEGDTLFRTAFTLNRALAGRAVTGFTSAYPKLTRVHEDAPITGRTVVSVRALGKHLLIELSGGLTLRTHLRMNGQWHIYRPGERWQRPRAAARIVLETDRYVAVGFDVPVAEFLTPDEMRRHAVLGALGPDLLAEPFDEAEAHARLAAHPDAEIGEALLNQRIVAGIGNVFKSEVLFVCGIDPFRRVASLSEEERGSVLASARKLLRANLVRDDRRLPAATGGYRRTTRFTDPAARLWVYGRGGKPCRRCATSIESRQHGPDARLTYWCPRCQR